VRETSVLKMLRTLLFLRVCIVPPLVADTYPNLRKQNKNAHTEIVAGHAQRAVASEGFGHNGADFGERGVIVILPLVVMFDQLFNFRVGRGRCSDGQRNRRQKSHVSQTRVARPCPR
jgi:hypothetical protein